MAARARPAPGVLNTGAMHRTQSEGSVGGLFVDGDPETPGAIVGADWLNDLQENIVAVILAAGLSPVMGRTNDLLDAIHQRIAALTGTPFAGIDDLRANTSPQKVVVAVADTAAVYWFKDPNDTSSADDGATVIVDAIGQRWRPRPVAGGIVYDDGSNVQQFQPAQPGATNSKTFRQAAAPVLLADDLHGGDLWYDTDDGNKLYRWDGFAWQPTIDDGSQAGRDLALAAFNLGLTLEQVAQGSQGSAISALNVNDWGGEWTPANRSHKVGFSVNRSTGRVTVKHRGHNGHSGTATATLHLEVLGGNSLASYSNVDAETALAGDAGTPIDFDAATNEWGPNGFAWTEALAGVESDSFEVYLADFPVGPETQFRVRVTELSTTDGLAFSWVFLGDKPVVVDPGVPFQLAFTIADTADNDALLLTNGPAVPGADKRSTTIGIRVDYSAFATPNPGEAFVHGFDQSGNPADVDAFMVWQGAILTVEKQPVFTGSTGSGYVVFDTTKSGKFAISGQGARNIAFATKSSLGWTYDNNTALRVAFSPAVTDVVIGTMTTDDDDVVEANVWPYGLACSVVAQASADVTSENTAADVAAVFGTPAAIIASGAATGQELADALDLAGLTQSVADFVSFTNQGGMSYPLANLNVREWYDSPYAPPTAGAMFRVRIDRPAKVVEVLFGGFSGHTGGASVDVELEVIGGNTFTAYANTSAESALTGSSGTPIDFTVADTWGPNGLRWTETVTGTDQDKFEMTLADVPGASTVFRMRIYDVQSASYSAFVALGDLLVGAEPQLPMQLIFSPVDGTDYDVLTMVHAPAHAGATNSKTFRQDSAPDEIADDLHEGDQWYDTDDGNKLYRFDADDGWVSTQDAGAAAGAALSLEFDTVGTSVAQLAAASELSPLGALNVGEWYDSPYQPATEAAVMLRIRIDRPAKLLEVLFGGFNGYSGASAIDVELEIGAGNVFTGYDGDTNEAALTGDDSTPIDFGTANTWGPNGFRWSETTTGTGDPDKFTMDLDVVPGAGTAFRLRVRSWSGSGPMHFALGDRLALVDRGTPFTCFFSPTDGTDLDVLVMQNAPAEAGATNSKTFRQTGAPANPGDDLHSGDQWFDTDDGNKHYRWSGSAWEEVIDQGSETGRDIEDAVTGYGQDATVSDYVDRINRASEFVGGPAQNVSSWTNYASTGVRGPHFQVRFDRTNDRLYVRNFGANGHVGTAEVSVEVEFIDILADSITDVSTELTPSGSNSATVTFGAAIPSDTLEWGKNGVRWREQLTDSEADEFYVEFTTALARGAGFRCRVFSLTTTDVLAYPRVTLGDSVVQANPSNGNLEFVFAPVDSEDYDVLVMVGAEPIRYGTGGSFRNGFEGLDFDDWAGAEPPTAETGVTYSGSRSGKFTSAVTSPSASGVPGSAYVAIPASSAIEFAGRRVRVSLYARQPASNQSAQFAVCYSTNTAAETSGWTNFVPTGAWVRYAFTYDVPAQSAAHAHYVGVHGDTSHTSKDVLIDSVLVELVTAGEDVDAADLTGTSFLVSSVEVSIDEITTPATIFTGGADYATWVDLIDTAITCTGTDLVTIEGSAELLIDQTVDQSDLTTVSLNLSSTTGWTLGGGWSNSNGRMMHLDATDASTLSYALTGLTAGRYYTATFQSTAGTGFGFFTMSLSNAAAFEDTEALTATNASVTTNKVSFKATSTTSTVTFTPNGAWSGYLDYFEVTRTAPGLGGANIIRLGFGPGGPTIRWRLRRNSVTVYESQDFLVSGAGQVPALFLEHVDTSAPAGSNTYKFQVYWDRNQYSSGQVASWDITSDRKSTVRGTGTYWSTYLGSGTVLTFGSPAITAEVVSVTDNVTALVIPTYFVATSSSFVTGTAATVAVPSGAMSCRIRVYGAGAGGGYISTGSTQAGGGGGGAYVEKFVTFISSDWGKVFTYTVGVHGTGRALASGTGSGTSGTASTVSTTNMNFTNLAISAGGGALGTSTTNGAGGTASGGDQNLNGKTGASQGAGGVAGDGYDDFSGTQAGHGGSGGYPAISSGADGNDGRIVFEFLADTEGSSNTAYTSLNSTHKMELRMSKANIQATEYRN